MVDHGVLFRMLRDGGLPLPILRFMLSWYATQQMPVCWGFCLSDVFHVSNGVRQGSVLSPVVYLDGLLAELSGSGVGCYIGVVYFMVYLVPKPSRAPARKIRGFLAFAESSRVIGSWCVLLCGVLFCASAYRK